MVQCVNNQVVSIWFPSYAFSDQCADGVPIAEIKSSFSIRNGYFANIFSKALDFKVHSSNNDIIDMYFWYLLIRSEQAEEGARSFLLLWLV
jgi:hypothetical protein